MTKTKSSATPKTTRKQAEAIIQLSEAQYRLLADHMKDYVWLMDLNLQWQYISPSVEKLLGYTLNELKQFPLDRLLTEKSLKSAADTFLAEMPKNLASPQTIPYEVILELECLGRDGSIFLIETTFSLIRDEDGKPVNLLCEGRDITERRLMEDKLRYEEERFRALIEHSSDIIVVVNRQEDITYINPAIERVLGFKPDERIGARGIELVHPDDMKFLSGSFDTLINDANAPVIRGEMRLLHKDGSFTPFEAVGSNLVKERIVEAVIFNLRDITERKKAEDLLRESEKRYLELSIIDNLTQLYNSRHFYSQLEKEIERSKRYEQPLTLILLDLDNFKAFNDTYGHVEGDSVLSRLGQTLKRCLRDADSAYRYGGEEFTILLPMTTSDEGMVTAQRIQTEWGKEAFYPAGREVHLTMSTGISQYILNEEMKAFVHRVDQIMYHAKKTGKDRICSGT
jgi:diguanylate cyclase (GGDEF)-like protein/PAS domain S-box-containing protein